LLVLAPGSATTCVPPSIALLSMDGSITSKSGTTCDGKWSGTGTVYVRRSVETVLSTSASRLLWQTSSPPSGVKGLGASCSPSVALQTDGAGSIAAFRPLMSGDVWYAGEDAIDVSLNFWVADRNPVRWNPMARDTNVLHEEIAVSSSSTGATTVERIERTLTVPSSQSPNQLTVRLRLIGAKVNDSFVVPISTKSPRGAETAYALTVLKKNRPADDVCQ